MKISQETNEFKPITIVLETRKEAETLKKILGETEGSNIMDEVYFFLLEKLK